MKISVKDLIEKEAYVELIHYYSKNKLYDIDFNDKIITFIDDELYHTIWLAENFKLACIIKCNGEKYNYERGLLIKYENSTGYWRKIYYNDKGLEIKFKNSSGDWEKRYYNNEDLLIKYENSNGNKRDYTKNIKSANFKIEEK